MIQTPLELLKQTLKELEKARGKSLISFKDGLIDSELHETHVNNLTPMISSYRYAIRVLETYL